MERDPQPFERMFRAHHDAVLAYALRRAGCEADARDVVAETFLVAWRRFGEAPGDAQLPWLYGVARRALANRRRAAGRRTALVGRLGWAAAAPGPHDPTARTSDGALAAALDRLSEADREALLLVTWEGLSADIDALSADIDARTARVVRTLGEARNWPATRAASTAGDATTQAVVATAAARGDAAAVRRVYRTNCAP